MMLSASLIALSGFALFVVYAVWRFKKAERNLEQMFATVEHLEQEKAVAQAQVKQFEVRKNNEKNHRAADRNDLIDRLQQQGDLRD
ncbi:DUF2681 domain-containing protein [Avibacterium paragallinarum]|uniref:Protein of uncharacterized function (DUF2681) n=1 Tax=Avibacterium paragallinarum TaxID=728 RepID=A0A377IUT3_AVIPA|nr:DUF2681 domain-containing protein [Avibacterium paragallinarum]POY46187.1 hypothetical protein C3364_08810 [Avibacterium paragallinarum]TID29377.1 hypothetical protein JO83_00230 [Avibacterium paragallinarum]STO71090.1 Protein of uncharacterised function (DUF2681) [Avibacterium paragallinarum]STO92046.1 Protein of uncharacterised function (DUF2681) [Avibacterium paragallinarum]